MITIVLGMTVSVIRKGGFWAAEKDLEIEQLSTHGITNAWLYRKHKSKNH